MILALCQHQLIVLFVSPVSCKRPHSVLTKEPLELLLTQKAFSQIQILECSITVSLIWPA